MVSKSISVFNRFFEEYDQWFDKHPAIFQSELNALKKVMPKSGVGLEVGVGTGRFASALGVCYGIEPAAAMRSIAISRGIQALDGKAESLPFPDRYFDFVLLITTLCFVHDPEKALYEAHRVLKPNGKIIIGMIDRDSKLGRSYETNKQTNLFYEYAHFYSVHEVSELLQKTGFRIMQIYQTLFSTLKDIKTIEPVKRGNGAGGFVVIGAEFPE